MWRMFTKATETGIVADGKRVYIPKRLAFITPNDWEKFQMACYDRADYSAMKRLERKISNPKANHTIEDKSKLDFLRLNRVDQGALKADPLVALTCTGLGWSPIANKGGVGEKYIKTVREFKEKATSYMETYAFNPDTTEGKAKAMKELKNLYIRFFDLHKSETFSRPDTFKALTPSNRLVGFIASQTILLKSTTQKDDNGDYFIGAAWDEVGDSALYKLMALGIMECCGLKTEISKKQGGEPDECYNCVR